MKQKITGMAVTPDDFSLVSEFTTLITIDDDMNSKKKEDVVNHPKHYTEHPSGIECIQITEHMSFCLGNAIKYIWRADLKNGIEDLKKAAWYINREIDRRENVVKK